MEIEAAHKRRQITIATKTAITDSSKSGSDNADPKFRNSDYVARLLALFNCKIKGCP